MMLARLYRFIIQASPPVVYLPLTVLWGTGLTGMLVVSSTPARPWPVAGDLLITVITLFLAMMLLRALDDIRDLDYDLAHSPQRPLARNVVSVHDLVVFITAGSVVLLAINADRGMALLALTISLGYAIGLVAVNTRLHWPASENMLLHLALNLPIQIMLSFYVYVAFIQANHLTLDVEGLCATLAAILAFVHLEFARKVTRAPAQSERTYVHYIGLGGTLAVASTASLLGVVLAAFAARPWSPVSPAHGWGWLAFAPLTVPLLTGWVFRRRRLRRWPAYGALAFPLCAFCVFLAIGLLGRVP